MAVVAALLMAGTAAAQNSGGTWRLPPAQGAVRQGVEVRPQQPIAVHPGAFPANPSFPHPVRPVAFTLVPAILMSDGSIFANFGFGYEPVVRPCNGVVVVGQPRRIASGGLVLSQAKPTPYMQPAPTQMTESQRMIAQGARLSGPAQLACFNRDGAGRIFVYRRI